jgi:hypothetical protein
MPPVIVGCGLAIAAVPVPGDAVLAAARSVVPPPPHAERKTEANSVMAPAFKKDVFMSTPSLGRTANGLLALALTAHHQKIGLAKGFRSWKCRNITIKIGLFVTNGRQLAINLALKKTPECANRVYLPLGTPPKTTNWVVRIVESSR